MINLAAEVWDLCIRIEGVAEDGVLNGLHDVCVAVVLDGYEGFM